ncbi:MAG: GntR family transcriptional regulator, partial [Campylobacteraceae bacterium]|nr:GntR family transcriptional regulator [Campylobacteraceae bacterium]
MPENNLSSKAYRILEELLVTLVLEPGKTYSEKELMVISDLSRTPLRE